MRGYPGKIATKQDFLNLLGIDEFQQQATIDLKKIAAIDDSKMTIATTLKDPEDESKGFNTKIQTNPSPTWKQLGFTSKQEITDVIKEFGFEIPAEEGKPTMDNTKAEIKAYMDENGIEYNSSDLKADLLQKIEWHNN